jgi:osmotically-inducible protein OsmY
MMGEEDMCWKCLLRSWWIILPVFLVLGYFAIQDKWPDIEADLQGRATRNMRANGLDEIEVSFRDLGRTGRLTGTVESKELSDQAVSLAQATYGVSGVIDQVLVVEAIVIDDPKFNQNAIMGQVFLDGVVSSSDERNLLVAAAVKRFGASNIVDNIVISEAVASQHWFTKLVDQLNVHYGLTTISVEGDSVTVTGVVVSEALREQVLADIRARIGDSYLLVDDITVEESPVLDNTSADIASQQWQPMFASVLISFRGYYSVNS